MISGGLSDSCQRVIGTPKGSQPPLLLCLLISSEVAIKCLLQGFSADRSDVTRTDSCLNSESPGPSVFGIRWIRSVGDVQKFYSNKSVFKKSSLGHSLALQAQSRPPSQSIPMKPTKRGWGSLSEPGGIHSYLTDPEILPSRAPKSSL